ncbi:putative quinol monooxygenase [Chryseobacterium sp.]|uniref:putative quinol monooxygenase n=1 Tax=Chryseobacterium sp. TaxID=1871047 RepID=UPI0012A7DEEC|nr:putative quinol monooxygenase [Chryseobacterium sp.]QFG52872.1 antibiotic biosynthesis monooxygenase [Chryseobacterium sp.]
MKELYIVALFRFRENYLMDAVEILNKLVYETRKEEGCLQYDLVEDTDQKGVFFIAELWRSAEHHRQHNVSEHLMEFRRLAAPLLEGAVQVYRGYKTF